MQEPTRSAEIYVQPEHQYTKLDLYLSLDDTFYILEETPAPHLSASGKAVKFTDKHNKWWGPGPRPPGDPPDRAQGDGA